MKKSKIKVWDYQDAVHGGASWHTDMDNGVLYEVDAFCVDDYFAVFENPITPGQFCIGLGDDGHWRIDCRFGNFSLHDIIEALLLYKSECQYCNKTQPVSTPK